VQTAACAALGDARAEIRWAVLRQGRTPPARRLRLREDLLEGLTISLEELPIFGRFLFIVEGLPRPSKPGEHVCQSDPVSNDATGIKRFP
jgi:hypothetical protein